MDDAKNLTRTFLNRTFLIAALLVATGSCTREPAPPNRQQNLKSPSGAHVVTMMKGRDPNLPATNVWVVSIRDPSGAIEYQDFDSHFIWTLNVYWIWDADDRLWLYNSDDGRVWYWERVDGKWTKNRLRQRHEPPTGPQPNPPPEVYPQGHSKALRLSA